MSRMMHATLRVALLAAALSALAFVSAAAQTTSRPAQGTPAGVSAPDPPIEAQTAPIVNAPASAAKKFEYKDDVKSLPSILLHQWSPAADVPPEAIISQSYLRSADNEVRRLTLKQTVYLALRNNPNVLAAWLNPVANTEAVNAQNAIFDPDLTSSLGRINASTPITTPLEVPSGFALTTTLYQWNFAVNKILATTNGTLSLTFNNQHQNTNNLTQTVNPSYAPTLGLSLSQPLLRNFGWKFATINVQLAKSAQKQSQWQYGQSLMDFVQQIGSQYWAVVQAAENLRVAAEALKFNDDLVRQNTIAVRVGTLAPIDLQEAQSAAATARANVYTAEATLQNARVALRQNVLLNPAHTFIPQAIEPADQPNPVQTEIEPEEEALRNAVLYGPTLGAMREAIRGALLQVKFQENQLLPQATTSTQIGTTQLGGTAQCGPSFGLITGNCTTPGSTRPNNGIRLPFTGGYGETLGHLFDFAFYNYAASLSLERPLNNANARYALAQQRVGYEQLRMQYRAQLSQAVVAVEQALANLQAYVQSVTAAQQATGYARESLHDEQVRFRVGMATTHDLLQFENALVQAEGNEVQAEVGLEQARLALWHADGTILGRFDIRFRLQRPVETPWYAQF